MPRSSRPPHALDALGADGVGLLSTHRGTYLGDQRFEPLFEELDRRGAVAFAHPTMFTGTDVPSAPNTGSPIPTLPGSMLEFVFDTTRAVANLAFSGTLARTRTSGSSSPTRGCHSTTRGRRRSRLGPMPIVGSLSARNRVRDRDATGTLTLVQVTYAMGATQTITTFTRSAWQSLWTGSRATGADAA